MALAFALSGSFCVFGVLLTPHLLDYRVFAKMSTSNTKSLLMFCSDDVAHIRWTPEKGLKLRKFRGNDSRRKIENRLKDVGYEKCSHENLRSLENGKTTYVTFELIKAICRVYDVEIKEFVQFIALSGPVVEFLIEVTTPVQDVAIEK